MLANEASTKNLTWVNPAVEKLVSITPVSCTLAAFEDREEDAASVYRYIGTPQANSEGAGVRPWRSERDRLTERAAKEALVGRCRFNPN